MNLKLNMFLIIFAFFSSLNFSYAKTKLALNWKPEPEFGGFYAAQKEADLELLPGGAGQPIVQMVAAGKVNFGIASGDEVVIARARGADVVAIFAVYQTSPMGIMVHESSGINNLSDFFKTKMTVAIEKGLPFYKYLDKKYGFKNLKTVPYNGGVATFLHDKNFAQQVFVTAEPLTAKREKAHPKTFLIANSGYNPYNTVLITKGSFIKKNPELVKKIVEASYNGWTQYLKNPQPTNVLMHKLNPTMDLETFNQAAAAQKELIQIKNVKLGSMTKDRWAELTRQLLDLKLINKNIESSECFKNLL